jgi:hypothetical protein
VRKNHNIVKAEVRAATTILVGVPVQQTTLNYGTALTSPC